MSAEDRTLYPQLASEPVRAARWTRVASVALVALVTFLAVNVVGRAYLDRYTHNRGLWTPAQKWRMATEGAAHDWIAVGDSSCTHGVVPSEFGALGSAVNLCSVLQGGLGYGAWLFERYLETHDPPAGVLVMYTPPGWTWPMKPLVASQLREPSWYALSAARRDMIGGGGVAEALAYRYLPLYSEDLNLRGIVVEPSAWFRNSFRLDADGLMPIERAYPESVRRQTADFVADLQEASFELDPRSRAIFADIIDRAEREGVRVVLASAPLDEAVLSDPAASRYLDAMITALGRLAQGRPHVTVIREIRTYPAEVMENPWHLTIEPAREFSAWLAAEIGR